MSFFYFICHRIPLFFEIRSMKMSSFVLKLYWIGVVGIFNLDMQIVSLFEILLLSKLSLQHILLYKLVFEQVKHWTDGSKSVPGSCTRIVQIHEKHLNLSVSCPDYLSCYIAPSPVGLDWDYWIGSKLRNQTFYDCHCQWNVQKMILPLEALFPGSSNKWNSIWIKLCKTVF